MAKFKAWCSYELLCPKMCKFYFLNIHVCGTEVSLFLYLNKKCFLALSKQWGYKYFDGPLILFSSNKTSHGSAYDGEKPYIKGSSYSFLPKWRIHQMMLPFLLAMVLQRSKWRLRIMLAKKLMTFWKSLLLWIMLLPGEIIKWITQVKFVILFFFLFVFMFIVYTTNFNIQPSAFLTLLSFI